MTCGSKLCMHSSRQVVKFRVYLWARAAKRPELLALMATLGLCLCNDNTSQCLSAAQDSPTLLSHLSSRHMLHNHKDFFHETLWRSHLLWRISRKQEGTPPQHKHDKCLYRSS